MIYSVALTRSVPTFSSLQAVLADKWPLLTWYLLIGLSILTGRSVGEFSGFERNPIMPLTDIMWFWGLICFFCWPFLTLLPLWMFLHGRHLQMFEKFAADWASGWRILHLYSLIMLGMLGTVCWFGVAHYGSAFFFISQDWLVPAILKP